MSKKTLLSEELESSTTSVANLIEQSHRRELELQMLELIRESRSDEERYIACLRYGQLLVNKKRWDEAGEYLVESARIALRKNDNLGLALSHEKLGDLATAEGEWLSARHHYRYALRKANHSLEPTLLTQLEAKANSAQAMLYSTVIAQKPDLIPLGQEYLHENLAISFVHRDIFLKSYFARCLECSFCHDWCCSFGADIDIQNVEKIQQQRDEIMPFIRPSEVEWFERDYSYYEEYDGNQFTRINPQGPRCVFISKDQRGCGLHRYALSRQMDYHEIKPLVCILFPLSFSEGVLSLAPELDDDSLVCAGAGSSAYRSLRNELEYYFGRDCVEELDAIESRVLSQR